MTWGRHWQTVVQIWPTALFLKCPQVKNGFAFVKNWKTFKEEWYFATHENYIKFKFDSPKIKFGWNTATLICLWGVYACFHAAVAQLCSCDRNYMAHRAENTYSPARFRRSLPTSNLINYWTKVTNQVIINQLFVSSECNVVSGDSIPRSPYHIVKIQKLLTRKI